MSATDLLTLTAALACLAAAPVRHGPGVTAGTLAFALLAAVRLSDFHLTAAAWFDLPGLHPGEGFSPSALFAGAVLAGAVPLLIAGFATCLDGDRSARLFTARVFCLVSAMVVLGGGLDTAGKLLPTQREALEVMERFAESAVDAAAVLLFVPAIGKRLTAWLQRQPAGTICAMRARTTGVWSREEA